MQAQLADDAAGDPCRFRVRDAQLGVIARRQSCAFESRIELRSGAEHDYQTHAEAVQERDVVNDILEVLVRDRAAAEHEHERAAAVSVDVRRSAAKPLGVLMRVHRLRQAGKTGREFCHMDGP